MTREYKLYVAWEAKDPAFSEFLDYVLHHTFDGASEECDNWKNPDKTYGASYEGTITLSGGRDEKAFHEELDEKLKELDPNAKLKTAWLYLERYDLELGDKIG